MFSLDIVDTDKFLEMPTSTQALYFQLGMRADDDGFVSSPKKITTLTGCSIDDLRLLIAKGFVIGLETGIVIIKDWKINNYIQKDRYKVTKYIEELKNLKVSENGSYDYATNNTEIDCIQNGYKTDTQVRLGKSNNINIINDIYCRAGEEPAQPHISKTNNSNSETIKEIINYLNQKTGKSFKATTAGSKRHINARLKDGFTINDFKAVIDNKTSQWLNDSEMNKYLRPSTLFASRFESYLNENTQGVNNKPERVIDDNSPDFKNWSDEKLSSLYNSLH